MKIRYKTISAGPQGIFHVGDEATVPDDVGSRLVAGGFADPIGVKSVAAVSVNEVKAIVVKPKTIKPKATKAR